MKELLVSGVASTQDFFVHSGHLIYCVCHIFNIAFGHTCHAAKHLQWSQRWHSIFFSFERENPILDSYRKGIFNLYKLMMLFHLTLIPIRNHEA